MHLIQGVVQLLVDLTSNKATGDSNEFSAEEALQQAITSQQKEWGNNAPIAPAGTYVYAFPNMETGRRLMRVSLSRAQPNIRCLGRRLPIEEGVLGSVLPQNSLPLIGQGRVWIWS